MSVAMSRPTTESEEEMESTPRRARPGDIARAREAIEAGDLGHPLTADKISAALKVGLKHARLVRDTLTKVTPQIGDTVRVVVEGECTGRYFENCFRLDSDFVKSIEIITPAKPDTRNLPASTVIQATDGMVYVKKAWGWRGIDGTAYDDSDLDSVAWWVLVPKVDK